MKLKKLAALFMAALMAMSLAACTKEEPGAPAGGGEPSQSQGQDDKTADNNDSKDSKEDDAPAEKKTLIVGTSADFAPYEFHKMVDGEDKILGFDIALAQKIADEMGAELEIKDMDFNSLLIELQSGKLDLVAAGLSPDPKRAKEVDFSDPYYFGSQCCIIREEDAEKYKSTEDFDGVPVAAQVGSIQEGLVKDLFPGATLVSLAKLPDEILSLSSGKVDGVVVETAVANGFIAQNPGLMIGFDVPYDAKGSCLAVQKGDTELLEHVNSVIAEVTTNGEMDEMVTQANLDAEGAEE